VSEAYVAIARKWRPLTLEEMVGQPHVTRTLRNALSTGRIHHAFLFTGARGVGKTTAARALARALNCVQGPTAAPCGVCGPCTEILAGTSTDVIEIDGASNNSVEDIRDLRDGVRYLPASARFRIYIIDEVHMLSKGAFNALLKTLEEPPPHVKFLFATTEVNKIPETILSRVQRFDFKRIPVSVVVGRLRHICDAEQIGLSDAALRMVARAGEGSMRDAQSLLDQVISFGGPNPDDAQVADILGLVDRTFLYDMLEGILRGEPDRCLDAIDRVFEHGYEMSQFTAELLELVRNAALVALSPGARKHLDAPEEEKGRLEQLAGGVPAEQLSRIFHVLLEVHDQVARAARPRMVLEMAVASLLAVRPAQPIAPLVDRLVDIERRLRAAGATVPAARSASRQREPADDPEGER
jgi:DNA polymerase-3 subunit gamma/tau